MVKYSVPAEKRGLKLKRQGELFHVYETPPTKKMRRQLCLEDCYQVRQASRQNPPERRIHPKLEQAVKPKRTIAEELSIDLIPSVGSPA